MKTFDDDALEQKFTDAKTMYNEYQKVISTRVDMSNPQEVDRKSTRLNSSHVSESRMPSSA